MKLLIVLGEGGHTTEMLNLVDLLGDGYEYAYVVSRQDNLSANRIKYLGPVYALTRPRGKHSGLLTAVLFTLRAALEAIRVVFRERPVAIVCTGPAIAVPISLAGKFSGARIIFIETGSRVRALSLTGRIMYRWADLFLVQWPSLAEKLPRTVYAGRLL